MLSPNLPARLVRLDAVQLTDGARTCRQDGYRPEVRDYALGLLEMQGISRADLQLAGQPDSHTCDQAEAPYAAYPTAVWRSFIRYSVVLGLNTMGFFGRPAGGGIGLTTKPNLLLF